MDEIVQAPQAPKNTQQFDQPPVGESPKEHGTIRKIFNASSWFVFFALLPVTVLILLSQNTIPGDLFYPIKRGMENVVLAAASVSPATRVAFRTDLTERRFDEAEKLLLARADTTGLSDFVKEVQTAQQEISTVSNSESKQELTEKLVKKIDEYQDKLVEIQAKTQSSPAISPFPTNTPVPKVAQSEPTIQIIPLTPTPTSIIQKVTPTSKQQIIRSKPTSSQPSLTISIEPTSIAPTAATPTIEPSPTQVQIEPTITASPKPPSNNIEAAIDDTQKRLDKIKDKLKERPKEKVEKEKKIKEEERSTDVSFKDEEDEEGKKEKKGKK